MWPIKYRKKPLVIEAWRLDYSDSLQWLEVAKWCDGYLQDPETNGTVLTIETLEGAMEAGPGDYIIKGIGGEYYPCKPHIFEDTYELVK